MASSIIKRQLDMSNADNISFQTGAYYSSASFNTPEETGCWYMSGVSNASPTGNAVWGMLFQMRSPKSVHPATVDAVYTQIFIHVNGTVYSRVFNNNAWTAWKTL